MKQMYELIAVVIANHVLKVDNMDVLRFDVIVSILTTLYSSFIKYDNITPIEKLPVQKKQQYWDMTLKYYGERDKRIKAAKAAYTLSLITATDT